MTGGENATLVVAGVAAVASIVAAFKASSTASKLQAREHDYQDRTRDDERCREFQSTFLTEIRGADLPPLPPGTGSTERLRMLGGLREVAQNCIDRSFRAEHTVAQLRIFCEPEVAVVAGEAVGALRAYGLSILAFLFDELEDHDTDDSGAKMVAAAGSYTAAVAAYETAARRPAS